MVLRHASHRKAAHCSIRPQNQRHRSVRTSGRKTAADIPDMGAQPRSHYTYLQPTRTARPECARHSPRFGSIRARSRRHRIPPAKGVSYERVLREHAVYCTTVLAPHACKTMAFRHHARQHAGLAASHSAQRNTYAQ